MEITESYKNALENDFCIQGTFQGNSPAEIALKMVDLLENIKKSHVAIVTGFKHSNQNIPIAATSAWTELYELLDDSPC